jgi:GH25 family lysozyme M1 (1,4-beta-N-acetylmuramidase)
MKKLITCTAVLASACLATSTAKAGRAYGCDVSAYQGSINWTDVNNAGAHFAWARATTGYEFSEDSSFTSNMNAGKSAGLLMGAYHFSHLYANTPAQEAGYFWNFASPYITVNVSLSPVLDFEVFSGHDGASSYAAWCEDWFADIKSDASVRKFTTFNPIIYVGACTGACELDGSSGGGFPWIANYNGENSETGTPWNECTSCDPWGGWDVWQFTSKASISGISGYVDEDVFNGSNMVGSYLQIK